MTTPKELYDLHLTCLFEINYQEATGRDGDWIPSRWEELPDYEQRQWASFLEKLKSKVL